MEFFARLTLSICTVNERVFFIDIVGKHRYQFSGSVWHFVHREQFERPKWGFFLHLLDRGSNISVQRAKASLSDIDDGRKRWKSKCAPIAFACKSCLLVAATTFKLHWQQLLTGLHEATLLLCHVLCMVSGSATGQLQSAATRSPAFGSASKIRERSLTTSHWSAPPP